MKHLIIYISVLAVMLGTSCSDFLDTVPRDALSPNTTWQTEQDAEKFLVGCYDGWTDDGGLLYWDTASDFGFNYHIHEGWKNIGNGGMTASNAVANYYGFGMIRRCNDFLINIEDVEFSDQSKKDNMIGQVKAIRAFQYFERNWMYGGIPIIESYETAEEAMVPRNTEEQVKEFIYKELDEAITLLNDKPASRGYIAKGAALAMKMRASLYYGDYQLAINAAKSIMNLGQYDLDPSFSNLFTLAGQDSKEIIISYQHDANLYSFWLLAAMYNNDVGGWSSIVPTQNLIDTYEMSNGLTKDEVGSGYDAVHPFANRDPRMAMSVIFPGMDWNGGIYNSLDAEISGAKNPNNPNDADNASKTSLTWGKYLTDISQYSDMWSTNANIIIFRYAEVLLSFAEAENELNGPSNDVYNAIDEIRARVGMPAVDRAKYGTKEALRELIRRERGVELAGEGLRRADILRWKDSSGKMLAETLLNGPLMRVTGTVDYSEPDQFKRAKISGTTKVEDREFKPTNRYLPIPQSALDKNPELMQNPGY